LADTLFFISVHASVVCVKAHAARSLSARQRENNITPL